jgi:hypothetical protein
MNNANRTSAVPRAIRIAIRLVILGSILCVVIWAGREYRRSSHESRVAAQIVEKGGYIVRPRQSIPKILQASDENVNKPVGLLLEDTTLLRATNGLLGVRIQMATFFAPEASSEFASILRQSASIVTVRFPGDPSLTLRPPVQLVAALQGLSFQILEFDRYIITQDDMNEFSKSIIAPCVVFAACTLPAASVKDLRGVDGLKTVVIHNCNLDGSPQDIDDAIESLRSAGIKVIYE